MSRRFTAPTDTGWLTDPLVSLPPRRVRVPSAAELHAGNLARPTAEMSEAEQAALFTAIKRAVEGCSL